RVDLVSEAEMLSGLRRAVRLPVDEAQAVLRNVEMGIEADGFLQVLRGLLRAALLQISAPDQVVHFGRGVEFEGASEVRQGFVQLPITREEASEAVMGGERMIVEIQGALQMNLGRFRFALVAAQQTEQQPGAEMIALFVKRAAQEDRRFERLAQVKIVFAD